MKMQRALITAAFVLVIGYIIYSSTGLAKVSCDVCVEINGRKACNSAAGATREEALNAAKGAACAEVASGRDESIACNDTLPPKTVTCK